MLEQNQGRARFKLAVFCGFALHLLFVGGLLMVGCKKDQGAEQAAEQNTAGAPAEGDTNILSNIDTNLASGTAVVSNDQHLTPVAPPVPATNEVAPPVPGPIGGGSSTEYVVTKGDSFSTIAKKTGVTVKAIQDANPTVVPTKLKVGQKLQIPAPSSSAAPVSGSSATHTTSTSGAATYTVKSGDSLTKIASKYGVSIKALRSANNMKTDRIKVGDKLKIPASASTAAPAEAPAPTDTAPTASTSSVPTLPPPAPGR